MNYCTAIKMRELLLCATWRNFTKITSREISQTHIQKNTYSMILFLCIAKLSSGGRKKGAMIGRGHEGFWGTGNVYFFYLGGGDMDVFIFSISLICVLMIWAHFYLCVIHKFKIKSKKDMGDVFN